MEFKYHVDQNQRTSSPMMGPLSTVTYVSKNSLEGSEFLPGGFPSNVPTPNVFPTPVPVNANEVLQREFEKQQIRREIFAGEMVLARRRELEEEVRREMALETALGIPLGNSFRERVSIASEMSFNRRLHYRDNNINVFGAPQSQLVPQFHTKQRLRLTNNDNNVFTLAKPDVRLYGTKRKAIPSPTIEDSNNPPLILPKKPKQEWSCALCHITTTSEKGLNDHLQGKKHKAKEASLRC